MQGQNMVDVKNQNRRSILQLLHEQSGISRKYLAEKLNLTSAAVSGIVGDLIKEQIVIEGEAISNNKSAGRKELMLRLSDECYGIGLTILTNETICAVVNFSGKVLFEEHLPLPVNLKIPVEGLHYLGYYILDVLNRENLPIEKVMGVGITLRGYINSKTGISEHTFELWDQPVDVKKLIEDVLPLNVLVDNNVRSMLCAQNFLDKDSSTQNALFIRSEYGIGGALMMNKNIYSGWSVRAGEIGHVKILENNRLCRCGNIGCLESISSVYAIISTLKELFDKDVTPKLFSLAKGNPDNITIGIVMQAVSSGDTKVLEIIQNGVEAFAYAVSQAAKFIDVQKIILYGKIFDNDCYREMLFKAFAEYGIEPSTGNCLEVSDYNCQLEAVSASILALQDFINRGADRSLSQ